MICSRAFLCMLVFGFSIGNLKAEGEKILEKIPEIRALPRETAAQGIPVRIRAIVTLRTRHGVFVHDGHANIWASRHNLAPDLLEGTIVEIFGITAQTGYSSWIQVQSISPVGMGVLPPARKVSMSRLLSGAEDSQFVELEGVVQEFIPGRDEFNPMVIIAVDGQLCRVKIQDDMDASYLVDARVRIRGVFQPQKNLRSQSLGLEMYVRAKEIKMLTPPPADAFHAPRVEIQNLLSFNPDVNLNHRRVVKGTVTFIYPEKFFFIEDGSVSLRIDGAAKGLAIGDRVEVAGFVTLEHTLAGLRGAQIRIMGKNPTPSVKDATPKEILQPPISNPWAGAASIDLSGRVVRLRGKLLRVLSNPEETAQILLIDADGVVFCAFLPAKSSEARNWIVGSEVGLTGICELDFHPDITSLENITHPISGFHLWLSASESVQVLQTPPWWTPQRLWLALAAALILFGGSLGWIAWLRREVARRGAKLAREITAAQKARFEFETTLRERKRLAIDLHDNLEQTLTGLSMQLEAADLYRTSEPERSGKHMLYARQFLHRSREDLHRTVWDLRAFELEGKNLAECLREKAAHLITEHSAMIDVETLGDEMPLPDFIAGNLLLFTQEAMTNALKHADADHIRIFIEQNESGVYISIQDDGKGFDPAHAPSHHDGHFGLQGMYERFKRLGGTFSVKSQLGKGTMIEGFVPNASFCTTEGVI